MKCKDCIAKVDKGHKCLAGINSFTLRSGDKGCCCNTRQVIKYMKEEGNDPNQQSEPCHLATHSSAPNWMSVK